MGISITRAAVGRDRSETLARRIDRTGGVCLGCTGCRGLCSELIEALVVPDLVLGDTKD